MPSGTLTAVTTLAFSSSGPNSSSPSALTPSRAALREQRVALEDAWQRLVLDHLERNVQRANQRDRRREGAVGRAACCCPFSVRSQSK